MKFVSLAICFATLMVLCSPVRAAEPAEKGSLVNPYRDEIMVMAKDLSKEYSKEQALVLSKIHGGFGMIRAVRLVKNDVAKAVKVCAQDNPDLAEKITARFDQWNDGIEPLLVQNKERMNNAINDGGLPNEKKLKAYLDLIDKAAAHADSKIEKKIVSTPDACEGLIQSMDRTEPTMVELLQNIKWPGAAAEKKEE